MKKILIFILYFLFCEAFQIAFADESPPSVTVLSPNGGEILKVGETRTIRVRASDDTLLSTIILYLSKNDGSTWDLIGSIEIRPYMPLDPTRVYPGETRTESFDWKIPDVQSSHCLIRADAYDVTGKRGTDMSDRVFTIERIPDTTSPTVRLLTPNGGELWEARRTYTINWEASDPLNAWETSDNPNRIKINILFSDTGGRLGWGYIARDLPNTGSYRWTINYWPEKSYPLENCIIMVEAIDLSGNKSSDTSDSVFRIAAGDNIPPTVRVVSPNGGEVWMVGERRTINWQASDNVGVSGIDISLEGFESGVRYKTVWIARGITNTGNYDFVPDLPWTQCKINIVARDAAGNTASDSSDREFTIEALPHDMSRPRLQILSPPPESVVKGGAGGFELKVRATDDVGLRDFTIEYFKNNVALGRDTFPALPGTNITQILHPRVYGTDRYVLYVTVTDKSGKSDRKELPVYSDDAPPTISNVWPPTAPTGDPHRETLRTRDSLITIRADVVDRGMAGVKEVRLLDEMDRVLATRNRPYEGNTYVFDYRRRSGEKGMVCYIQAFDKVGNMSRTNLINITFEEAPPPPPGGGVKREPIRKPIIPK
jgi:hypothetical protein